MALDRLPLEEAINRDNAAPPAIGIPEGRLDFVPPRPSPTG